MRPVVFLVCPFNIDPPFTGGATRINGMRNVLSKEFQVITLAPVYTTLKPAPHSTVEPNYHVFGRGLRREQFYCPSLISSARRMAKRDKPAAVIAASYAATLNAHRIAKALDIPLVVDHFNVEHERFQTMGRSIVAKILYAVERYSMRNASLAFAVSAHDQEVLQAMNPKVPVVLAANGFDPTVFHPDPKSGQRLRERLETLEATKVALFAGRLDYGPNRTAFWTIVKDLAPAFPNIQFWIVGPNAPAAEVPPNVRVLGPVQETASYIRAADIFLAPLWSGGGTKLKVIEAAACARPILTTPHGVEGLPPRLAQTMTVCPNPQAFQAALKVQPGSFKVPCRYDETAIQSFSWQSTMRLATDHLKELCQ
ncbi:MAG: glycosyltransferase family 4 protein [Thermoplasmatota archaeon]